MFFKQILSERPEIDVRKKNILSLYLVSGISRNKKKGTN